MPACDSCGQHVEGGFPFCPHCGAALTSAPPPREQRKRNLAKVAQVRHRMTAEEGQAGPV